MAVFKAAAGASFNDVEAQTIGEVLETLGEFTPHQVVEAAASESSPLHKYFEWDDSAAAASYRVWQARQIISHVTIVVKVSTEKVETKAFHNVIVQAANAAPEHRYVAFKVAVKSSPIKQQIIEKALIELKSWKDRYAQYSEIFGAVFSEIEKADVQVRSRLEQTRKANGSNSAIQPRV